MSISYICCSAADKRSSDSISGGLIGIASAGTMVGLAAGFSDSPDATVESTDGSLASPNVG